MIRRSQGTERWMLISQVEHARLSGALAEAWGNEPFALLEPHDEIVAAVTHHDDGWSAWEVAPKVDPQAGRPLDFTETPLTDSLAIWRESIRRAADIGPLAAYMVSGHFSALLERFPTRWKSDASLRLLAQEFLTDEHVDRQRALARWQTSIGSGGKQLAADWAVAWLQLFDATSLWLCCAERTEGQPFQPPDGPEFSMRASSGPYQVEVSPWPFRVNDLRLEVVGRSVLAKHYANSSDLVTTPAEPVTLAWRLSPA